MALVDLSTWQFSLGGGHPAFKGTPHYAEPERLTFAESLDLLLHLAADRTREPEIQNQIRRRLKEDPVAKQWHKQRTKLKSQPHFNLYRKTPHYESYHEAARATVRGTHTPKQHIMVDGLNAEIDASNTVVPVGQIVFPWQSGL